MNPCRQTIDNPSGDTHVDRLRGVPTDGDISALQARNRERAERAVKRMGTLYCCHPVNGPQRATESQWLKADLCINAMKSSGEIRRREDAAALADQIQWGQS